MRGIPYTEKRLAESIEEFTAKVTPAKERWLYCYDRSTYAFSSEKYGTGRSINIRAIPSASRFLGSTEHAVKFNFFRLSSVGNYDEARAQANAKAYSILGDRFAVGPMQGWHVGHLYFARVVSHPHVVKIGFSRRVRDRFEDIESKAKTKLMMRKGEIRVGTLTDEHWWHREWRDTRISGEWFYDPKESERSLPDFLISEDQKAVAA